MEPRFEAEQLFDEDYLYFYGPREEETTETEVDALWRILELAPGTEVLDAPCGHGRIANRLAERGCRVTGLDATQLFLDVARRDAAARGVDVEYVHGDMRSLPWHERFDVVLNWFTSFGYFSDDDNRKVLAEARRALKPGGRFVLELIHRDNLMRRFVPEGVVERDGNVMVDFRAVDVLTGRMETDRLVVRDGRSRRMHFSIRMFAFRELRDWLLQAGFVDVGGYDGESGEPLALDSRRMVVVATK